MPSTATATFPGLNLRGAVLPFSKGVTPSIGTLYVLPQDGLDLPPGDLVFSYGSNTIAHRQAAVGTAFIRKNYDGKWPIWAVSVFDRRWTWAGKTVSGDWNRRLTDGTIDPLTKKTPQEMADLICRALGEIGADTSRMPQNVYPRMQLSSHRADLALAQLCDYVACDVSLNWQSDQVEIWPSGSGSTTPTNQYEMLPKYRYLPRTGVPSTIEVVCGDSQFQSKLKLSAVGRDYSSGQQKLASNVSYNPGAGESPFSFPRITDSNNQLNAFEEIYRDYRITGQQDGSLSVPNCQESIQGVEQYLLSDTLLETETDLENHKRNLPCYVDGDYWSYTDLPTNASSQRYTGQFRLNPDRKMVSFPYPIFKVDSSGNYAEPSLYLTTGYRVKSVDDKPVRITRSLFIGVFGGKLTLRRPEIFAIYSTSTSPNAQTNTEAQANQEADAYLSLFQQKFNSQMASEIKYPGLLPYKLDGNLAQITWHWTINREPYTQVCENEELDTSAVDRNERRRREQLAQILERYG